ncbi:hypothetical protein GC163_22535 [bacterium]|nr:hypothetical protein [bacterium]
MKTVAPLSLIVLLSVVLVADGQVYRNYGYRNPGYGGWWGGVGIYAGGIGTTPAESYARGQADVLRAQGQAYEAAARGAVSYEQARATYIENQERWHQIQMERQKQGEQARAEKQAADRAARERRQANQSPPTPQLALSDSQYDRASGTVHWPLLLGDARFNTNREELEQELLLRAHVGSTLDNDARIVATTDALIAQLKADIKTLPPTDYIEARKFLNALKNEVEQPAG